jgi:glycosyltransferase involved in cell wall biosynthesis
VYSTELSAAPGPDQAHEAIGQERLVPPPEARIAVIVPTRHEAETVGELYRHVSSVLCGRSWELIFVDDSDDETVARLNDLAHRDGHVRVIHRTPGERAGGLGGAVLAGFAATAADVLVVMDSDLQHPPATITELVDALTGEGADIVVATRYRGSGSAAGLHGLFRSWASRGCRSLVHAVLPATRVSTDPLGGFFALRREVLHETTLRPDGYKILLEILVRGRWRTVREVEYTFGARLEGVSKSGLAEARRFLRHVWTLGRTADGFRAAGTRAAAPVARRSPSGRDGAALRVLLFTSEVAPVVSGIATSMGNLRRGLAGIGHQVEVVSRTDFPHFVRKELRLSAFVLAWPRFRKRLAAFDVVNVHGPVPTMSEMFLLMAALMRRKHRPTVIYTHHSDLAIPGLRWGCSIYNQLHRWIAHSADAILVSSAEYREKLHLGARTPIEIIPWGIDARQVLPRPHRATESLRVLFVGQLRPYKGARVLVDAVSGLPGVAVTIIGDGPERPLLEDRVRAGGLDNVSILGRVSDAELWLAYSRHDVIVLPSLTTAEAYGLVLGEGMAAGCVPVASDLPGVRGVAGATGLLVPPGDVGALRAALHRLATDHALLTKLALGSRMRAAEMSVETATARHDDVFRRALERSRARRGPASARRSTIHPKRHPERRSSAQPVDR